MFEYSVGYLIRKLDDYDWLDRVNFAGLHRSVLVLLKLICFVSYVGHSISYIGFSISHIQDANSHIVNSNSYVDDTNVYVEGDKTCVGYIKLLTQH